MASIWRRIFGIDDRPKQAVETAARPTIPAPPVVGVPTPLPTPQPIALGVAAESGEVALEIAQTNWQILEVPELDVEKWQKHGFSAYDAAEWRAAGCPHAFLADRWRRDHFTSIDAGRWISGGITNPNGTAIWTSAGWTAERAAIWLHHGIKSPKVASQWERVGIMPATARSWIDSGLHDPELAAELIHNDIEPDEIREFSERKLAPASAAAWLIARQAISLAVWEHRFQWITQCANPHLADRWYSLGISPSALVDLNALQVTCDQFEGWCRSTGTQGAILHSWLIDGISPDEVDDWIGEDWFVGGSVSPYEMRQWRAEGFTRAADAANWRNLGIERAVARSWAGCRFTPEVAADWITCGVNDPNQAALWHQAGFTATEAAPWLQSGILGPLLAEPWQRAGIEPQQVPEWRDKFFAPEVAGAWKAAGVTDVASAVAWQGCNATPEAAAALNRAGISCVDAIVWKMNGIAVSSILEWHRKSWSPQHAGQWTQVGVTNAAEASRLAGLGVTTSDLASLIGRGLTPESAKSFASIGLGADLIAQWLRDGWNLADQDLICRCLEQPTLLKGWRASEIAPSDWWYWIPLFGAQPKLARRWKWRSVTKSELLQLRGTLSPSQIQWWAEHDALPRDLIAKPKPVANYVEPRHFVAPPSPPNQSAKPTPQGSVANQPSAASSRHEDQPTDDWLDAGKQWMSWIKLPASKTNPLLEAIYDEGLSWATPEDRVFPVCPTEEWLSEFLATAEQLAPDLRRTPQWPAIFRSEACTIVLVGDGTWVYAWVGKAGRGVLVKFRPSDFEVVYPDDDDARLAIGAAVCWYVDLAFTVARTPDHPHYSRPSSAPRSVRRQRENTYVPKPQFNADVTALAKRLRLRPRAHRVEGHIRTLSAGHTPTDEARAKAPAYLRRLMGPHDTFVRAHVRGGKQGNLEYRIHLTKFSMLADCLGSLQLM